MSLLSTIKKILPGSSRSLHAMHEDMDRRFDEVFARIEQADNGINMNINYKFDTRLFPEIELLKQRQQSLSEQMRLRFELLARRAYPDLTPFELRCKIFDALPDAEGDIRLMQQANAALMSKLDAICAANNIQYWLSYGSLVGTLSRSGFIPWDDDIDICMLRSDVDKLTAALKDDPEYQITLVYDWFVKCRQVRFCSTNSLIPCFVDISIYDRAAENSKRANDRLRQLRIELWISLTKMNMSLVFGKIILGCFIPTVVLACSAGMLTWKLREQLFLLRRLILSRAYSIRLTKRLMHLVC